MLLALLIKNLVIPIDYLKTLVGLKEYKMFINIITPCSRPENLLKISESINIPKENYRWIVVFDLESFPDSQLIPNNCEYFLHKNYDSVSGNSQRNFALDLISDGYVYFNDDDTLLHSELWENIKDLENDFISFIQENKNGTIRLFGNNIRVGQIDSHNFIVHSSIVGDIRWVINKYDADGYFASECFHKSKNNKHINIVLSTYNILR
jgi:hypothetical protein